MHAPLRALALASLLAAPLATLAQPAPVLSATCDVRIDYSLNGNLLEPYATQFSVQEGVPFEHDFSTPTRQKIFNADLLRSATGTTVRVAYLNDVGTFDAILLDTSLELKRRGSTESAAARQTFSTSQGSAGNHMVNWSLSCRGR